MGVINGEGEVSGSGVRTRVRISCMVWSMGKIGLHLEFRSGSDVRTMARLKFKIMMRHGRH